MNLLFKSKKLLSVVMVLALCTCMLYVNSSASASKAIKLNKTSISLNAGSSFKLKVKGNYKKAVYSSSNKKIAKVTSSGKIKALKAGKTVITAKITLKTKKQKKLRCKVTVVKSVIQTTVPAQTSTVTIAPSVVTSTAAVTIIPTSIVTSTPIPTKTAKPKAPTATPIPTSTYAATTLPFNTASTSTIFAPSVRSESENNPILTNSYACDPYAMEYNGRLYVYMTNDTQQYETGNRKENNTYGYIQSMHIMSTDDMVNWKDEGIFQIAGKTGVCKWSGCCWAPCAVHKTVNGKEKFYIYFTNGGYQIGVVSADSPTGPFTDVKGSALLGPQTNNTVSTNPLDPAAFIDDDGTAYLTFGGSKGAMIYQLNDDMISFTGSPISLNAPYMFEDSGINKIGDKYYYSYCSDWNTRSSDYSSLGLCSIAYMVSDNVTGPYTYAGDILPNCGTVFGTWGNNHHSMVEFKGQYYMFYHTMVLQDKLGCSLGYRSTQVNKVTISSGGAIQQVKQDLAGVDQIVAFDPYQETTGTTSYNCGGMVAIHNNYDGAYMMPIYLPDIYKYSWTSIKGADFGETSASKFTADFDGPENSSASIKVCLDSLDGKCIAESNISFDSTGSATVNVPVSNVTGTHDIYFELNGQIYNFKSWSFSR